MDTLQHILGKKVERVTQLDQTLVSQLIACKTANDEFDAVAAKTMCANDFYEGRSSTMCYNLYTSPTGM